jgi:ABC-type dipeptide/oligopeptide/nickel transport system ATPase subunit
MTDSPLTHTGAGVTATSGGVAAGAAAAGAGGVAVAGNVSGHIHVSNHTVDVNTNYGTIINRGDTPPVTRRDVRQQPPRAPLDFFDRTNELAQIDQLINANKPIAIYGHDGAGKSTLLRQAANSAAHARPDGVVLIENVDANGTALKLDDVIQRLFDALYQSDPPLKVNDAIARTYLTNTAPLVLLDGVRLSAPDQYRTLIDLFPNSSILIALPASLPGLARPIKLGPLPRADAIELLAAQSGVFIGDATRPAADAICALLNDVPLATVRAADVIREQSLSLDQARGILAAAPTPSNDPIEIGLARAYALAYSTLSDEERSVLATAAQLPGVSIDPATLTDKADIVERLKTLGLLHANSPRVRIDPGLRPLAAANADETAIMDRLIARLLADVRLGRFSDDAYCANELGNILGAIEWTAAHARWAQVIALARAIDPYLTLHGLWEAWGENLDRALAAARALGDQHVEAWATHQLGTHALNRDVNHAIQFYRQALAQRQSLGDTIGAAYSKHNLDVLIPPPPPPREQPQPPSPPPTPPVVIPALVKVAVLAIVGIAVVAIGVLFTGSLFVGPQACDVPPRLSPFRPEVPLRDQIEQAKAIAPGDSAAIEFTEEMLDNYVRDFGAENGLLREGQARFAGDNALVICGDYQDQQLGSVGVAARFHFQPEADEPVALDGIAARALDTGSAFGWVALPTGLAGSVVNQIKQFMGDRFIITDLRAPREGDVWRVEIRGK